MQTVRVKTPAGEVVHERLEARDIIIGTSDANNDIVIVTKEGERFYLPSAYIVQGITVDVAIIKNSVVMSTSVYKDLEEARQLLAAGAWDADDVCELPEGYGIGDIYKDGIWEKAPQPEQPEKPVPGLSDGEIGFVRGMLSSAGGIKDD